MTHCIFRSNSFNWLPFQTSTNEIYKLLVFASNQSFKRFRVWDVSDTFGILGFLQLHIICEVIFTFASPLYYHLTIAKLFGGVPRYSTIKASCSASSSPGNKGNPKNSSPNMHPKLHISIAHE